VKDTEGWLGVCERARGDEEGQRGCRAKGWPK
jgi:hypothetical protein